MKKARIYYTVINHRCELRQHRQRTIEIPEEMYTGWDWDGIVKIFRCEIKPHMVNDDVVIVTSIKVGSALLK